MGSAIGLRGHHGALAVATVMKGLAALHQPTKEARSADGLFYVVLSASASAPTIGSFKSCALRRELGIGESNSAWPCSPSS
jgi:hypothetical protein